MISIILWENKIMRNITFYQTTQYHFIFMDFVISYRLFICQKQKVFTKKMWEIYRY